MKLIKLKVVLFSLFFSIILFTSVHAATDLFKDVPSSHWANEYIETVYDKGIMNGYEDGSFKPSQPITRAEVAKITTKIINLQEESIAQIKNDEERTINTVAKVMGSVVMIDLKLGGSDGICSGFLVEGNQVVTANHCVNGYSDITIRLVSGETYTPEIVRTDEYNDLALLQIQSDNDLPYFKLSEEVINGQTALIIGNPQGLEFSVSKGIVSHDARSGMIQVDTAVNFGNSGGAIFNLDGEVLGVVTGKMTGSGVESLGFGASVEVLKAFLNGEKLIKLSK